MKTVILAAILAVSAHAADLPTMFGANSLPAARESVEQSARKAWKVSLIPLFTSQALDAASSYGMRELNPLLADPNGGFGVKATSIKLGVTGALAGVEYLVIRKYPRSARIMAKLNWTSGIVTTGFAVHNYAIK